MNQCFSEPTPPETVNLDMKKEYQAMSRLVRNALFALLLTGSVIQFTGFALAQEQPNDRPRRPDGQDRGQGPGQGRGGGRREMAENKTPLSPNPGQTVGLFLNTPKAFTGYTLFAPKHNTVTYLMDNQGQVCTPVEERLRAWAIRLSAPKRPPGARRHVEGPRWHGRWRRRSHRGV